ncbi:nucleotidyltransferase family protein [bacterium]|nr:nucleotidyltransferase family protein [bacterium]
MKSMPYWKRNIEFYINRTFVESENADIESIEGSIVEHFRNKYITESDKKLLNLFFKKDVLQEELDKFLEEWDIEREGGHKALMLSYFMKNHPELSYSPYIKPRLDGILKYYKFKNLNILSHYKKICTALISSNINFLIMKGGALRHYNPDFPRIMADVDILIKDKKYEKAKNIAIKMGYKYTEYWHSIDLYETVSNNTVLDIHHKIDLQAKNEVSLNRDLFNRANREKVFGIEGVYVPCPEDMMFLLLSNLNKNLMRNTSYHSILYSIIDSMYLFNLKSDFDWNIVRENAIKTKTESQVAVAIKFLNEYVPIKLPEMFSDEFYDKSILSVYDGVFVDKLREESRSLKFNNIKSLSDLVYYVSFRLKYILYRRKFISKNVKFAKKILEKQGIIK